MKRFKDWLVYLLVRVCFCLVQTLRIETCHVVARGLAVLACDIVRVRRGLVDENLSHCFPDLDARQRHAVARQMWEHLFLMVFEIAHVPRKLHDTNWRRYIQFQGKREMLRYLLDSRPRLLVSGHFGNFELASYFSGMFGFRSYAIARPLDNPFLHRFVNRFRESKGQFILPKEGSANQVAEILEAGGTLSLLGDQHAGPKACWVDFMGRPASCHKALALFTLVSGAPMLVMSCTRQGQPLHFELRLEGLADPASLDPALANVTALTQWYNQMLEKAIRRSPAQYWWVHRRWREAPQRRSAAKPTSAETVPQPTANRSAA